ncbi:MAG: Ig-like domain-containing protein [Bacteroides sp.]|nr:Ig-like domain-containing protein [Bacteroides sp.]
MKLNNMSTVVFCLLAIFWANVRADVVTVYSNTFDDIGDIGTLFVVERDFSFYDPPPPQLHHIDVVDGQLEMTYDYYYPNGPGTSAVLKGRAFLMMDTSELNPIYKTRLADSPGVITWSFNLSNQDYFFNSQFAFVLASTTEDHLATNSYCYVLQGGGYVGNIMKLKRRNTMYEPEVNLIDIPSESGLSTLPSKGSFRITFDPITSTWSLFFTSGGAYSDPETVTTLLGEAIDDAHTSRDMRYIGWGGDNAGTVFFDNITISVDDTTPPAVQTHTPISDAVEVSSNSTVNIVFSEDVNPDSINLDAISVSNSDSSLSGDFTVLGDTVTVTPNPSMACDTVYTVQVTTDVADLAGNFLPSTYTYQFTTAAADVCGCGVPVEDSDIDGVPDCNDGCPQDGNKTTGGVCGCGVADTDTDSDGTANCIDEDDDDDGTPDWEDVFPLDPEESTDLDQDGAGDNADLDDDNDGVTDTEEDAATNNGDANQDGIADSQQAHIATLLTLDGTSYAVLEVPAGKTLHNCRTMPNPSINDSPTDLSFPYGFFEFTISNAQSNESVVLKISLPEGVTTDTYYKFGKTPGNTFDHWYEFLFDGDTGAEISDNIIWLHFQDGARGDDIQALDGMILDIGAPTVLPAKSGGQSSGGGCFINSVAKI